MQNGPRLLVGIVIACVLCLAQGSVRAQSSGCGGDCNGDSAVSINELIRGVNIALGNLALSECDAFDENGDGRVAVNELVRAVSNALTNCTNAGLPLLEGSDAVMAAARLALSTADAVQIIDLGFAGDDGSTAARTAGGLRLRRSRFAAARRGAGPTGNGVVVTRCARGGTAGIACAVDGGTSTRTVVYSQCREASPDGTLTVRDGQLVEIVGSGDYCATLEIPSGASVVLDLQNFVQTATDAGGALLNRRTATLRDSFAPDGDGCAGPNGTDTVDGTLHFECNTAADARCTADTADVTLRAVGFAMRRSSSGTPCKIRVGLGGTLDIDNAATGDRFKQTFPDTAALVLSETALQGGDSLLQEDGRTSVQCLGQVEFQTDEDRAIRFAAQRDCPMDGDLRVELPSAASAGGSQAGLLSRVAPAPALVADAPVSENGGAREIGFRAANGQVYQVLQNPAGNPELGTEDVRVTTLIGSADAVARCDAAAGSAFPAQAVVASAAGQAFALDGVRKSGIIPDASQPCFNGNAAGGDGALCLGPGCTADCRCPGGGCATFTIADGTPLTQAGAVPAATLVAGLGDIGDPCSGFAGLQTYAFGAAQPTTEAALCSAAPADGLTLRGGGGETLIVAYPARFAVGFNIGSAGFAIDADGSNPVQSCGAANRIITGVSNRTQLAPPLVRFGDAQQVEFDFNGDDVVDRAVTRCGDLAVAPCQRRTPTPTPTQGINPPCPQRDLPSLDVITRREATSNQPDVLGGATCGDGGNAAPERSYRYRAPTDGFYTIDTLDTEGVEQPFDTLLYVRRGGDCNGPELACNDNAQAGVLQSQVGLTLRAGEEIAIVVDGSGGERGGFQLRIGRSEQSPTPTATRTPTVRSDLPDLLVAAVSAPTAAGIGQLIDVAATVRNESANPAGEFEVAFVFASDAELTQDVVDSGFSCTISGLAADANDGCALRIRVPPTLLDGTYYLGAVADAANDVAEADESNNRRPADSGAIVLSGGSPRPTDTPATPVATDTAGMPSATATAASSATLTPSRTATATATTSGTSVTTATSTATRTVTSTAIASATPTPTEPNATATAANPTTTPLTNTATATATATPEPELTPTPSAVASFTATPSATATAVLTATATAPPTATRTVTSTAIGTPTPPVDALGTPFRVNSDTAGNQLSPAVAAGADGEFVVVWASSDGASFGIFGQRYTNSGGAAGGEFDVNTTVTGNQRLPAVAKGDAGAFTVAWTSDGQDGDGAGIFAQRFTSSGGHSGFEFQVNSYTPGAQYKPKAVIAGSNDALTVVWNGVDAVDQGVIGRQFVGSVGGAEFVLSTRQQDAQTDPVIAADPQGNFITAWEDLGADGGLYGISGQRFGAGSSKLDGQFQVNSYTLDNQANPSVAMGPDGTALIVWQDASGQDGDAHGIFAQRYGSTGDRLGSEFQVNTYTKSSQIRSDVAARANGEFIVVWQSLGQDGSEHGVYAQLLSSQGERIGTEFRVNTSTLLDQTDPHVATGTGTDFVVVWQNETGANDYDIFARRYRRR